MAGDDNVNDNKGGALGDLVKAESMIQLAVAIPIGCGIGAFLGYLGDKHFHTGWMIVVGILVGAAGGFIQIFRAASGYLKRDGN